MLEIAVNSWHTDAIDPVASIPIPGGRSLRPVKNRGKSFDKVVDQNSPYFHWANYTFDKTVLIFYFPSIFPFSLLTNLPLFFISPNFLLDKLHPW